MPYRKYRKWAKVASYLLLMKCSDYTGHGETLSNGYPAQ